MENYIKTSIKDEEVNREKYPTKTIVFTSLIIGGILMIIALVALFLQ
jgi:hypothetical protein